MPPDYYSPMSKYVNNKKKSAVMQVHVQQRYVDCKIQTEYSFTYVGRKEAYRQTDWHSHYTYSVIYYCFLYLTTNVNQPTKYTVITDKLQIAYKVLIINK